MEVWKYDSIDLSTIVNRIPDKVFDDLPFGLIKLDSLGKILEYNMAEAALTGFTPESVLGKNFFLEVATCTQTPEFYGRFREGVDKGLLNVQFDYLFNSEMIPTRVRVRMVKMNQHVWLMVTRLNVQGEAIDVARAPSYVPPPQAPYEYLVPVAAQPVQAPQPAPLPLAPQYQPSQPPVYQPAPPQFQPPQYQPQQPPPYPQSPQYGQPPSYAQAPNYPQQPPMQPQQPQPPLMQPQYAPAPAFAPQAAPVPAPAPAAPAPRKSSGLEDFDFS
jgi:photoactive yellow protein